MKKLKWKEVATVTFHQEISIIAKVMIIMKYNLEETLKHIRILIYMMYEDVFRVSRTQLALNRNMVSDIFYNHMLLWHEKKGNVMNSYTYNGECINGKWVWKGRFYRAGRVITTSILQEMILQINITGGIILSLINKQI